MAPSSTIFVGTGISGKVSLEIADDAGHTMPASTATIPYHRWIALFRTRGVARRHARSRRRRASSLLWDLQYRRCRAVYRSRRGSSHAAQYAISLNCAGVLPGNYTVRLMRMTKRLRSHSSSHGSACKDVASRS